MPQWRVPCPIDWRPARPSSERSAGGRGVLVKARNADIQGQAFLYRSRFLAPELISLEVPGQAVGLIKQGRAVRGGTDLNVPERRRHAKGGP